MVGRHPDPDLAVRIWVDRCWLVATWLVVAAGTALRVHQWWHGRSFWLDELLLLNAMEQQRFSELLQPLTNAQAAPPGWLLIQHVALGLTGESERGARVVPLLFGIGTLVLTVLLARTLFGGPAALLATAVVAISPQLIRYSNEFKQYSADSFWVLLLLLVATRIALGRGKPERDRWVLAGITAMVVWFSYAGTLASFGIFAALLALAAWRRRWRDVGLVAAAAAPAAAGFAVLYAVLLSRTTDDTTLQSFWAKVMPPGPLTPRVAGVWLAQRLQAVTADPLKWPWGPLAWALVLVGFAALAARRLPAALVLVGAVGAVFAAGLARIYPISGRLALFVVPVVALLVAATVDLPALAGRLRRGRTPAVAAAVAVALAAAGGTVQLSRPLLARDLVLLDRPLEQEQTRILYAAIAALRQPGDLVLVDEHAARYSAAFYGPRLGLGPYELVQVGRPGAECPAGWFGDRLTGVRRVWLVTVHSRSLDTLDYRSQLRQWGALTKQIRRPGAVVLLFTRYDAPLATGPEPPRCLFRVDPASRS